MKKILTIEKVPNRRIKPTGWYVADCIGTTIEVFRCKPKALRRARKWMTTREGSREYDVVSVGWMVGDDPKRAISWITPIVDHRKEK